MEGRRGEPQIDGQITSSSLNFKRNWYDWFFLSLPILPQIFGVWRVEMWKCSEWRGGLGWVPLSSLERVGRGQTGLKDFCRTALFLCLNCCRGRAELQRSDSGKEIFDTPLSFSHWNTQNISESKNFLSVILQAFQSHKGLFGKHIQLRGLVQLCSLVNERVMNWVYFAQQTCLKGKNHWEKKLHRCFSGSNGAVWNPFTRRGAAEEFSVCLE